MAPLIDFQDAVTAANLDANQDFAVFYTDGRFANRAAVRARCPHAKLFGITTTGQTGVGIFACDSEEGDLPVDKTETWVEEQIHLEVDPIAVYANEDRWLNQGLLARLAKYAHRIKRWDANANNIREIRPWADAEQWAFLGRIDRDVALATFFQRSKPHVIVRWESAEIQVAIPEGSKGTVRAAIHHDLVAGTWGVHGTPGENVRFSGPGGGQWRTRGIPVDSKPLGG